MKKKLIAILALLLALLMVLSVVIPAILSFADEEISSLQDDADELKDEENSLKNRIKNMSALTAEQKRIIEKYDNEISALSKEIDRYNARIGEIEEQIEKLNVEIAVEEANLAQAELDLAAARESENNYSELLERRIRAMYESQDAEYLDILLKADSVSDFFCKLEYIRQVAQYDKTILGKLKEARAAVEVYKASVEEHKRALEGSRSEAKAEQEELEATRAAKVSSLQALDKKQQAAEAELADLISETQSLEKSLAQVQEDLAAVEKEIARLKAAEEEKRRKEEALAAARMASSKVKELSGLSFFWPIWDARYTYVGSPWGYRVHPISGVYKRHTGCDIPCPNATPIHAAEAGVVIAAVKSGYNDGCGKYIIIQHANNVKTMYCHCSSVLVNVGDYVSRGDVIGKVGMTGAATGYHLHFELMFGWTDVDPVLYVPKAWPDED